MIMVMNTLKADSRISDYKINVHKKESYELFYVKGKLETLRCTDTCDKEVTVYVPHGDFLGDAQFYVYPYTTEEELKELTEEAVERALLIDNPAYHLPEADPEENFVHPADFQPVELAAMISDTVFGAEKPEHSDLNAVEIFINKHTETVLNSRGLDRTQVRFDGMVEAIPTYNGETQSVELYEQYNFGTFHAAAMKEEIETMMQAVKARYDAVKPDFAMDCKVVLNKVELAQLFDGIVDNMRYLSVYNHSGVFKKGDMIQKDVSGDIISITMQGESDGVYTSSRFDRDGLLLGSTPIVTEGKVVGYYGANRYGQYLGEKPTGIMECMCVAPGSLEKAQIREGKYLEVISMSGLQVDFFSDYIGGEIRLANYHDGEKTIPVTGISFSGSLSSALSSIRLSKETLVHDSYSGPAMAVLTDMKIY